MSSCCCSVGIVDGLGGNVVGLGYDICSRVYFGGGDNLCFHE